MKGIQKLERIGAKHTKARMSLDWTTSPEYENGMKEFLKNNETSVDFELSKEFANARMTFRKRVNS